jgi:hypothetical protein
MLVLMEDEKRLLGTAKTDVITVCSTLPKKPKLPSRRRVRNTHRNDTNDAAPAQRTGWCASGKASDNAATDAGRPA